MHKIELLGVRRDDRHQFGTKAAVLGELFQNGFSVPDGFALPASHFSDFLSANSFPHRPSDFTANSREIRQLIRTYPLPHSLSKTIQECVAQIKDQFPEDTIIVRTSALCEDQPSKSMAGAFASFPGLDTVQEVMDAVLECYSSLFSDRVLNQYALGRISASELSAGVIIQRCVTGEVSGVIFTVDPRKMDPTSLVISAVAGSCSGLTDGTKPATTYTLDRERLSIREVHGQNDILNAEQLSLLAKTALQIENSFGEFQDIEWTITQNQLYILQSRPITGFRIYAVLDQWEDDHFSDADQIWELKNDVCLPPLIADLIVKCENQAGACAYQYGMHWDAVRLIAKNGYIYQTAREVPDAEARMNAFLDRIKAQWDRGEDEFHKEIEPELSRLINSLHEQYTGKELSAQKLSEYLEDAAFFMERSSRLHWRATSSEWYMGYFFRQRIDRFYDSITGQDLVDMVYSRSLMTEEREKLYQMVELIQADPELCELFQEFKHDHIISARLARFQSDPACELRQMIEEYSRAYGWIYTEDLMDGVLPHPGSVSLVECVHRIRRFLHISIPEYRTNLQKMGENAARLRTKGFENCTSPEDRAALEMALKAGEKAFLAGDNHTFFICSRKYVYISDALIRTASVLAANDQINNLDDIRFLTLEEVKNALLEGSRFHDKVSERQKEYQKWSMRLPPERIGGGEPHSAETPEKQETRETPLIIKGESGTRKNVRGRIYLGFPSQPTEDDLILVLEHGHEGDLTTILHHVVGLIVKMGSPASHMGIIARELGIPAIYGVGEDISIMKSGDIVELHGQTGEIVLQNM